MTAFAFREEKELKKSGCEHTREKGQSTAHSILTQLTTFPFFSLCPQVRKQPVCLLPVSTCVFCAWKNEVDGMEADMVVAWSTHPHWPPEHSRVADLCFWEWLHKILARGKMLPASAFWWWMNPAYFCFRYLSCQSPFFSPSFSPDISVWTPTSFHLACCNRFLTGLPTGFRTSNIFC